ncbi:MAG: hypothetical protein AAF927_01665 [Bacteroidota bacterium]
MKTKTFLLTAAAALLAAAVFAGFMYVVQAANKRKGQGGDEAEPNV